MTRFCAVFPLFLCVSAAAEPQISYELRFPNAVHHEAEISAVLRGVAQPVLQVRMSRSSPGRYALHEFAKNVSRFRAEDSRGRALRVTRPNPHQWDVEGHDGTVRISYTLFADRADGTYSAIDSTHAHLNIPATLMWARGFEGAKASVVFHLAEGSQWKAATQLKREADGSYSAPDMQYLMDSPVELSNHKVREWEADGQKLRVVLHDQGTEEEAAAYARVCEAITLEAAGVFGALPKFDFGSYTFLLDYLPYASGDGMEHRNSTVIAGTRSLKDSAARSAGTVAHEFFHAWNVERIRPKSLEPFDFTEANMSGELWFAEGFTSYYAPLIQRRAGLISLQDFARSLGYMVNGVVNAPGREEYSAYEMSLQAPFIDAATANDPLNSQNTFISYYTYGAALALGIDLSIRTRFPGKSLDDWMRAMWRRHPDSSRPYTMQDLESALAEATGNAAFAREIFSRHITGKETMDYAGLLVAAGFEMRRAHPGEAWLGSQRFRFSDEGIRLDAGTVRGTPLFNAGLDRGDIITGIDGTTTKKREELDKWLKHRKPGDTAKLRVRSRTGEAEVKVTLGETPEFEIVPEEFSGKRLNSEAAAVRHAWLGSRAIRPLPHLEKYCPRDGQALPFEYAQCPDDGSGLLLVRRTTDGQP